MEAHLKKILRAVSLELRHVLEGTRDEHGEPVPGDLERRLNQLGIWRKRQAKPIDELPQLSAIDKKARTVVDAYLELREEAAVSRADAVGEFIRESAYTWANRLFALRCMEARGIIDEVILQKDVYGGRSLAHHRFAQRDVAAVQSEDEGLFAVLFAEFAERAKELPELFDPDSPAVALRPSVAGLKQCIALLSGREAVRGCDPASDEVFMAPDAFGWAYQYWNSEEKDRVFEMVRTQKGAKIEGVDIIPATQLYTEPYMVKFLVQNSLGAAWMCMHPESRLHEQWEYFLKQADRAPAKPKPAREITFLDPAMGSGHFHLEAFDLLWAMYEEEGEFTRPEQIAAAILNHNLFGLEIDERAVQIGMAALWMKAKDRASDLSAGDLTSFHQHFVAANIRLPQGRDHIEAFLSKHPEDKRLRPALEAAFLGLENAHELGSLLQIEGPVVRQLRELGEELDRIKARGGMGIQTKLFEKVEIQYQLPTGIESFDDWRNKTVTRLIEHFGAEAAAADPTQAFFSRSAGRALVMFDLLARQYDVVAANPPYMGLKTIGDRVKGYLELQYPDSGTDLFAAFIDRSFDLVSPNGRLAYVAQAVLLYLTTYAKIRERLLEHTAVECGVHVGPGGFEEISGEKVNTVLFVARSSAGGSLPDERGVFLRVVDVSEKAEAIRHPLESSIFVYGQRDFLKLRDAQFLYSAPQWVVALLSQGETVEDRYITAVGLQTGDNPRFIRRSWEVPPSARWKPLTMGGDNVAFYREDTTSIDWEGSGVRVRQQPSSVVRNSQHYFKTGLTFSRNTGTDLRTRILPQGHVFDQSSSCIIASEDDSLLLVGLFNSTVGRYLMQLLSPGLSFLPSDLGRLPLVEVPESSRLQAVSLVRRICDVLQVMATLTRPFPPHLPELYGRSTVSLREFAYELRQNAKDLLIQAEGDADALNNLWAEVYGLATQQLERSDVRLDHPKLDDVTVVESLVSGLVIDLCAQDLDGVIPITEVHKDPILHVRVRARLTAGGGARSDAAIDFEDMAGMALDRWLFTCFKGQHSSTFDRRPIVWQMESSSAEPVFACLIYYHKFSGDLLPKIRSQYVGPLRSRFETERATLNRSAIVSDDAAIRKVQLDKWIDELKAFEEVLRQVEAEGFATATAVKALHRHAVEDAVLCVKQQWLRRLAGVIEQGPLSSYEYVSLPCRL